MQLTVKEVAAMLNFSEKTIYRWIKKKNIPFYRINDQLRFNRAELLEWATSKRIPVSVEIFKDKEQGSTSLPSLTDALKAGGIAYRVGGGDQAAVLHTIVGLMNLPDEVDREFLYEVLLARETLGSTGVGEGIAIPHVRNPVVLHIQKPSVTLCFLEKAIDFKAIDGVPVNILFTLISPTVRAHLHLLSRIGYLLRNADFKYALKKQESREVLMELVSRIELDLPGEPDRAAGNTQ